MLVFQQFASKIGSVAADIFNYSQIDPSNTFAFISVHHIVQMLIAILVIFIISKCTGYNFYFKPKHSKVGVKYTLIFTGVMLVYVLISYLGVYFFNKIAAYVYPLNAVNVLGTLGFQMFLSGPSEEILFRALPVVVLTKVLNCTNKKDYYAPVFLSALLFSVAHINWTLFPFTISASWFQLIYAFVLGVVYATTYIKSKNIMYPMIMHSMSNVFMVGIGYLFAAFV